MPDIDFQRIELNLIPKQGEQPVVFYASQYETTRPFIADLMWGDSEFAPGPDCWAEIDIRKNDDNLVVITEDVAIDNNEVSVILPVQAVTCIGKNLGQVKIYAGEDQLIAALNFILEVQPDPLEGGVTSETDIDNLTQQIEDIAEEVIGEDYYDKTEVDALLADKADVSDLPNMSNYYTKSQTYSKSQIDYSMNLKADKSELDDYALKTWVVTNFVSPSYLGAHYYNKTQVDNLLFNMLPVGTASGAVATFETEIAGILQSLKANFLCSGGNGTPSTPIPLVPYTELNVVNKDENDVTKDSITIDLDGTRYGGYVDANNGKLVVNRGYKLFNGSDMAGWSLGGTYGTSTRFDWSDTSIKPNSVVISNQLPSGSVGNDREIITTHGSANRIILEIATSRLGTADVSGFATYLSSNNLEITYELATPIEVDISPEYLNAHTGVNNVSNDGNGTTEVSYKDTIQHYIDTRL